MVAASAYAQKAAGVRRFLACISFAAMVMTGSNCARELSQFVDEDRPISISYGGDNSGSMNVDQTGGYITVQFSADRFVNYTIRYGADCTTGALAGTLPQSGSAEAGVTVSARMNYSDLMANSGTGWICVADKAAYQKASLNKSFSVSAINNYVTQYNETYGASGAPMSSGITTEFQIFQVEQTSPGWSNNSVNRDGGATKQTGASLNYGMLTVLDPNDGYKLKMLVTDRNNHRVLVFNSIPKSNAATPDVVIGQTDFITGTSGVTQQKMNEPVSATVCSDGKLYVSDRTNHRIAGFNRIPQVSGAQMDFVLGQAGFTVNPLVAASASTFNLPYGIACISSRLYVADRGNNRIVVYDPAPSANVAASFAIGQPDLTTATPGTNYGAASYLKEPRQVSYGGSQFFITDSLNNRVLVFNSLPVSTGAAPSFRIGQILITDSSANQGGASPNPNSLSGPRALAFRSGKLAIADSGNHRLTFYNLPITFDNPAATHQMGQPNFSTGTVPGTTAKGTFSSPKDILFDGNYIWVQDAGNNRMQYLALPF